MGLWSSMSKALARVEMPFDGALVEMQTKMPVPITPAPFWPGDVWLGTATEPLLSRYTAYTASALAYLCIRYRATKLSEPPLMVVEQTDDGEEWLDKHPMAGLLAHPNPDYSMRRLLAVTSAYNDIQGASLWLKIRNNGREPVRLYPFGSHDYVIEPEKDRLFGKFRITTADGEVTVDAEDVVHFPGFDPFDPAGAVSPLEVALTILRVGEELKAATVDALKNAMAPSGVLSVPEPLNEPEFRLALAQLHEQHTGRNRGKPLLLTGGATWETIALTIQEMMPTEVLSWVEATVCAVFGIHPSLLGIKTGIENSPWSNLETAKVILYDEMAIPHWRAQEEIITDQLLRDVDFDENHIVRFDLGEVPALQDDDVAKLEMAKAGTGFLTINEQRAKAGYDPLPDKLGETVLIPATMVPLEMLVNGGIDMTAPRNNGSPSPNGGPPRDIEDEEDDDEADVPQAVGRRQ